MIFQQPGLERARDRRPPSRRPWPSCRRAFPPGLRYDDRLQPDRVHRPVGRRGDQHDLRGGDPGRPRGDPVPADLARRDHPDRRHPGLADRHLRGHGGARLLAQQPVAVRPGARHRHRRRRRDRGGRERRAQPARRAWRRARRRTSTMDEVGGALVAIALVLGAVFIPAAFISGISGQFFRQFAVTIAAATVISCLVSLTPQPGALRAPAQAPCRTETGPRGRCCCARCTASSRGFNWRLRPAVARLWRPDPRLRAAVRRSCSLVYAGLIGADRLAVQSRAHRLHPAAGPGLSDHRDPAAAGLLARPHRCGRAPGRRDRRSARRASRTRCRSPASTAPPSPTPPTPARSSRRSQPVRRARCQGAHVGDHDPGRPVQAGYAAIEEAFIITIQPPPVRGIGTAGGFKMMVQDQRGRGLQALEAATQELVGRGQPDPRPRRRVLPVQHRHPQDLRRHRPGARPRCSGCTPDQVFEALEVYLGSAYVNDFNYLGRTYRVTAQADGPFRKELARRRRSARRATPRARWCRSARSRPSATSTGPYRVPRYNLYPAAEVQGSAGARHFDRRGARRPWRSWRGQVLPDGFGFEWTELAYRRSSRATPASWSSPPRWCSSSWCWRRSTRAGCCRSRSS